MVTHLVYLRLLILAAGFNNHSVPENDQCEQAFPIYPNGAPKIGTTAGATLEEKLFCDTSITAPGVWYSLVGSGTLTQVRLCEGTFFDTQVSVFEGTCEILFCVGSNDDFCSLQSAYLWYAKFGVTYYILVSIVCFQHAIA